ncbi:hypothetical protein ACLKMH_03135 [Psychromonas sp. KJ10-10]|uniref:hypothetical protein n=1 Tax=Psychromonas sp. KJ10-10 TaxID=3391823 RepID=UPI0039B4CD08
MKHRQQMKTNIQVLKDIFLIIVLSLYTSTSFSNEVDDQISQPLKMEYSIPDGVVGVIIIDSTRMGNLLQLRGIVGKGVLVTKQDIKQACFVSRLRLVAGGFDGSNVSIHSSTPIQLNIYAQEIIDKLEAGVEIISKDYLIIDHVAEGVGDIQIVTGLGLNHGFVLNPGEWSWSTLFDEKKKEVIC